MSNSILNNLKNQIPWKSVLVKLILVNVFIFALIGITAAIARVSHTDIVVLPILERIFTLPSTFNGFIHQPWGLITNIFTHFSFIHLLMNMMVLYFAGKLFLQFFSSGRLIHIYVIGGIVGGLIEIAAHTIFPQLGTLPVVGASGSIMAIFIAVAVYQPNVKVMFFGTFPVKLIVLAGAYILFDLMSMTSKTDHTAHFAHLGGALIGFLSVQNLHSSNNIINMSESFAQKWKLFWSTIFKPRTKLRVEKGGRTVKTDEQYNVEKKAKQEKTNKILDKISKSGYESLTKAEKEFLFSQSKND